MRAYDVSRGEPREGFKDVLKAAGEHRWALPITIVDGEVRMVGGVDYYSLDRLIRETLASTSDGRAEPSPAGAV